MTETTTGRYESTAFREAMATFPSGVTVVTTTAPDGRWWGFTATSFCSVSMDPPLVLVCLADTAECHPVFAQAQRWLVHIIRPEQSHLAIRFATRGADKFAGDNFTPDDYGLPKLKHAAVTLDCTTHTKLTAGDHTILLGHVKDVQLDPTPPALYYRRAFHPLPPQ